MTDTPPPLHEEPSHIGHLLEEALDHAEAAGTPTEGQQRGVVGLETGFEYLDWLIGGLEPGTLTVVASRPSIGRTTFLSDVARRNAIRNQQPVLVFTFEESTEAFIMRVLSAEARVARHHIRGGLMTDDDWTRLAKTVPVVASAPLFIQSPGRADMRFIADTTRDMIEEHDVQLIVVDGIQDIRPGKRSDLREREVGDIVRDLKTLARELNIPVLASSHLNRAAERRWGNRPELDDLRESGAITFAADTIILLHREDAYELDTPRAGEADLFVAKNRQGPTGTVVVAFQGHYGRFVHISKEDLESINAEAAKSMPPASDWLKDVFPKPPPAQ
ncbi:replicative DNA helicase [Streptomyces chilikensis]|uniref:DnaB-like helicase C-terminal domain-containing protein n=1 Tax=Streptomyces chilikensis TaxID=1194079 RepID=A0ABV3ERQ1_9ACTN